MMKRGERGQVEAESGQVRCRKTRIRCHVVWCCMVWDAGIRMVLEGDSTAVHFTSLYYHTGNGWCDIADIKVSSRRISRVK